MIAVYVPNPQTENNYAIRIKCQPEEAGIIARGLAAVIEREESSRSPDIGLISQAAGMINELARIVRR